MQNDMTTKSPDIVIRETCHWSQGDCAICMAVTEFRPGPQLFADCSEKQALVCKRCTARFDPILYDAFTARQPNRESDERPHEREANIDLPVLTAENVPERPLCGLCELCERRPPRKATEGLLCLQCAEYIDSKSDDWVCSYYEDLAYEQQGKRPQPRSLPSEIEVPF